MRRIYGFLGLLLLSIFGFAAAQSPTEEAVTEIPLLSKFERQFTIPGIYSNPYNPEEIAVTATFTNPAGQEISIPAFYMEPYTTDGTPNGDPTWAVRFTPTQVGEWSYVINTRDASGVTEILSDRFTVNTASTSGFIRVSPNGRYFSFQNGDAYFPIGQNLGWSWDGGGGLDTYIEWLDQLAARGANYARLFADTEFFIGLDWHGSAGNYTADQDAAALMDAVLAAAEERNIYLQVVLIWHEAFIQDPGAPVVVPTQPARPDIYTDFDSHPYNRLNGGVLSSPGVLFQTTDVFDLLERRLAYMLARWSYSPAIFAWEVITDVDRLPGYETETHAEMITQFANFVREHDPYNHLVTIGSREYLPEFTPIVDFVQLRQFATRPIGAAPEQVSAIRDMVNSIAVNKPVLITEFSINPWFEPTADDPTGIHIRNATWAALFSGTAGSAMPMWWDTYIAPQNLYDLYAPLARFTRDLPWQTSRFAPVEAALVADIEYQPLRLTDFNRSFRSATPADTIYHMTGDGVFPAIETMSSFLYGQTFNTQGSRPITLQFTAPVATEVTLAVRGVSGQGNAVMTITLDNVPYPRLELAPGAQDAQLDIPVSAGSHTLILDNIGADWLEFDFIEIRDYLAPLRAMSLVDSAQGIALAWVHHREYTWENGATLPEAQAFRLDIPLLPPGSYRVEFWDTVTGAILGEESVEVSTDNTLRIPLLPISTDLAVRAFRISGDAPITISSTLNPTRTPIASPTLPPTATLVPSNTPTATVTASHTSTPTDTPTLTPTATVTPSITASATSTATATLTNTPEPSATNTDVPTATLTTTPTLTRTPSPTNSATITRTATEAITATASTTASATNTPTPAATSTAPATPSVIPRQTRTPRP